MGCREQIRWASWCHSSLVLIAWISEVWSIPLRVQMFAMTVSDTVIPILNKFASDGPRMVLMYWQWLYGWLWFLQMLQ